jgi:phosphoribosylformimino-5-aminoimidazole carboxamide ribotide isomerase
MEVIAAIDLRGGQCVRLFQGRFDAETVFSPDPVEVALRWQNSGAPRLHVVDLDGAREGEPKQLDAVEKITSAVTIPVQVGGGLRTASDIEVVLELGADRAIVGTAAAQEMKFAHDIFMRFGDRVAVSLDGRDGKVAVEGWLRETEETVLEVGIRLAKTGAPLFIYTDIARDGALVGPDVAGVKILAEETGVPVIASGGISRMEHIAALARGGAAGCIVGRALYTGDLGPEIFRRLW